MTENYTLVIIKPVYAFSRGMVCKLLKSFYWTDELLENKNEIYNYPDCLKSIPLSTFD